VNPGGCFRGQADVTEAEIFGRFDGELTARVRLIVRSTGSVTGKIRYGHIIIEAGGVVAGEIAALDNADGSRPAGEEWPASTEMLASQVGLAE
jgi:cytoskeletal protein CcmA (bactofilin family)